MQKDTSDIKDGMEKMNKRISFIEKYLDIGDHKAVTAVPDSGSVNNSDMKVKMDSDNKRARRGASSGARIGPARRPAVAAGALSLVLALRQGPKRLRKKIPLPSCLPLLASKKSL